MSTLQARHRGHNIPDGVTTFNEIEYDREGGVFLTRTKLILLIVIVFLLSLFSAVVGRYTATRDIAQKSDMGVADSQIPFLAVEPESYKVFLDPKLYEADGTVTKHDVEYTGRVEVIFRPKTDTSVISLHVGLLKIVGDPELKRRLSMETPTEQVLQDDSKYELNTDVNTTLETLTVTVGESLRAGHYYSLFVNFTGTIGRNPEGGFFKVVFEHKKEVKPHWYVATKLAPRKARNLLPCVDNPKHKAIFEMSVVRSEETNVIFNTKVRSSEPYKNNLLIDHFEKTGLIRPDSLGIFMSNFESSQVSTTDGSIELTVWNPEPDDSIEIIKDIVPKTLDFMSSYLATRFPTNKLDIVVVPSTDITTAESPGLIVIEDKVMVTREKSSILEYQESVLAMVEHVIRQWLMPLRGLDRGSNEDKWLNEAIVKFLNIINIDHIKPEWKYGPQYSLNAVQPVMFYDSWTNSEPLSNYEHHTEIYKYINAAKGTSILRMLNDTFTEEIFKQTLREYVHTEIYKYKDTISFWTLLDDNARNKSVKLPENSAVLQIVNTWMQNKNYPLVKLTVDGDDLVLKQFRFDYNEPKPTNDWVIPITLTSGAAYSTTVWLDNAPETRIPGYISASNGTWILANQHQTGYYRVHYEDVLLDRILYEISKGDSFDEHTVAQLTADVFEVAFADAIGFSDALGLLERVIQRTDSYPGYWDAVFKVFAKLEAILYNSKHYDSLSLYMEMMVEKAYDSFQKNTPNTPDKLLGKMDMLSFAGRVELKKCVDWAKEQFLAWKKMPTDINPIAPNDRKSVYCTAMQYATKHENRFMLSKYKSSEWTPDRKAIAKSFSCSRNQQFLQMILLAENIQVCDLPDIWKSILDNPIAGPFAFNFLRNNWETLNEEYLKANVQLLATMLHAAVRGLNGLPDLETLQAFGEKYFGNAVEDRDPVLLDVLRFEEEILRQKITWREKYEAVISGWVSAKAAKKRHASGKTEVENSKVEATKSVVERGAEPSDARATEVGKNPPTDGKLSASKESAAASKESAAASKESAVASKESAAASKESVAVSKESAAAGVNPAEKPAETDNGMRSDAKNTSEPEKPVTES